jgi:hypothetical protein
MPVMRLDEPLLTFYVFPEHGRISAPPIRFGLERHDYFVDDVLSFYEVRIHLGSRIRWYRGKWSFIPQRSCCAAGGCGDNFVPLWVADLNHFQFIALAAAFCCVAEA